MLYMGREYIACLFVRSCEKNKKKLYIFRVILLGEVICNLTFFLHSSSYSAFEL